MGKLGFIKDDSEEDAREKAAPTFQMASHLPNNAIDDDDDDDDDNVEDKDDRDDALPLSRWHLTSSSPPLLTGKLPIITPPLLCTAVPPLDCDTIYSTDIAPGDAPVEDNTAAAWISPFSVYNACV